MVGALTAEQECGGKNQEDCHHHRTRSTTAGEQRYDCWGWRGVFGGADQVVGGWMRFSNGLSQLSASDGTYQPVQPLAWINLSGRDCCFLRMFVQLIAVECPLLATVGVGVCVCVRERNIVVKRGLKSNRYRSRSHPFRCCLVGLEQQDTNTKV